MARNKKQECLVEVIDVQFAKEYIMDNYSNDYLLSLIAIGLLDQLPKVLASISVHAHREARKDPKRTGKVASHKFPNARNELAEWIKSNQARFLGASSKGFYYGTMDVEYVYVTNDAFKKFCSLFGYDVIEILRCFDDAGYISSRKGEYHGGHHRTKRINSNLESCIWFRRDVLFD